MWVRRLLPCVAHSPSIVERQHLAGHDCFAFWCIEHLARCTVTGSLRSSQSINIERGSLCGRVSSETNVQALYSVRAHQIQTLRVRYARKGMAPRTF